MKVIISFAILVCCVCLVKSQDIACSNGADVAWIAISHDSENNTWAVGVSDIQISVNISCSKYFRQATYSIYLGKSESSKNRYFAAILFFDDGRLILENKDSQNRTVANAWSYQYNSITINITLRNLTMFGDTLFLIIRSVTYGHYFYSQPFFFKHCTNPKLPSDLLTIKDIGLQYVYEDTVNTTCSDALLFVETEYKTVMNLTCDRYAEWKIPNYKCVKGCLPSELPGHLILNTSFIEYVFIDDRVSVTCKSSYLFVEGKYQINMDATCGKKSTWETPNHICTTGCPTAQFPSHLRFYSPIDQPYVYSGYGASVSCKSLYLFAEGKYATKMQATCDNHSAWETPKHECTAGCSFSSSKFRIAPGQQAAPRYVDGTTLKVICRSGRMYYLSPSNYFISNAEIVCKGSGDWKMENVSCWKDWIVDFASSTKTLYSNGNTAFACTSSMTSHNVKITIGETVFQNQVTAWGVIVVTSKQNQVKAVCEVFNSSGIVVKKSSTLLNVQFSPELINGDLLFGVQKDGSGRAIIEFKANPKLSLGNIRVTKKDTLIQNYYLTYEGFTHRVIVDFPEIQATDLGDYVITMTSYSPVYNVLRRNFTIYQSEPTAAPMTTAPMSAAPMTAGQGAGITIGVVIGIVLAVFIAFMSKRAWDKYKTTESTETSNTVEYDTGVPQEHHNYEDIKDKQEESDDEFDNDSVHDSGYVNVNFQGSNSQNVNTGIKINTVNANRKVVVKPPIAQKPPIGQKPAIALKLPIAQKPPIALKPPTGRGRPVAQSSNPYELPRAPRWR